MTSCAITGIGVASALGVGQSEHFSAFRGEPRTLSPDELESPRAASIKSFDASKYTDPPLLEVPNFDATKYLGDKGLRTLDRLTKLLVVTARLALHDAGLKKDNAWTSLSPVQVGVCCSNAYGSLEAITELDRVAVLEDARYINPAKFPNTVSNSASGYVAIWEDLRALNVSVSDGNCGALDAVACADLLLTSQRADAILTGGGEAMSEALYLAFDKLGVLGASSPTGERACLGEGAAFFVLEPPHLAQARGANVLASITGYGTSFVAPNDDVTLLFASSVALERAITAALEDAKLAASDVDLVASSISGIPRFDDAERAAITKTLGSVPVAAPKLLFGETLGVSGALATTAALAWLLGVPPTCLVAGAPPSDNLRTVLVTSVGYYGNASAIVLRRS